MTEILKSLIDNLGKSIGIVLILMFNTIDKSINFLTKMVKRKDEKEREEKVENKNRELRDVCDNGTLDDLINAKFLFLVAVFSIICTGCFSSGPKIDINLVRPWEGHYMTVEDFREKTKDIRLENNESVWVLTNKTLYNILKDRNGK